MMPVDDLVWTSLEPFARRARRAAVTVAAIGRVLEEDRPLGAETDEFLDLHRWLRALDPEVFTRLMATPQGYSWARRTEAALARAVADDGAGDARPALARQLEEVKALVVAAAVDSGLSMRFSRPYEVRDPLSVALTDLVIVGDGPVRIEGVDDGVLMARRGGATAPAPVEREPTLSARHGSIRLSPHVIQVSGIDSPDRRTALSYGLARHRRAAPVMEESFDLLAEYAPDAHAQIVASVDTIALHDPKEGDRSQESLSDAPGTFIVAAYPNPWVNVECIVHEAFHNRLFALEAMGPVFEDDAIESGGGQTVFSPWRVENRPLKGLLHSAYVFAPVVEYWLALWGGGRAPREQLAYALDDVIRHSVQLRMGVELLRRRGRFTPWGNELTAALDRRVRAIESACGRAGVPDDADAMKMLLDGRVVPLRWQGHERVSVRQNIRANIERSDVNGDIRSLALVV